MQVEKLEQRRAEFDLGESAAPRDDPRALLIGQLEVRTRAQGFTGTRLEQAAVLVQYAFEQQLDLAAAWFARKQPRVDDASVVEHQQIARAQESRQVAKHEIAKLAACTIEREKPTRAALRRRRLGDQFRWQLIVKIRASHARRMVAKSPEPPPNGRL